MQLDMAQRELEREYRDLNDEFAQFENSRQYIKDDSLKRELSDKYEAARIQVEKLQQELKSQKRKSAPKYRNCATKSTLSAPFSATMWKK